jgi:hypothetical protein
MYASGANMANTSATGLPGSRVQNGTGITDKVSSYIVPPNAEHGYDDESIVFYGSGPNGLGRPGQGFNLGGISGGTVGSGVYGGTWFAKLYGNAKIVPWWRVTVSGLYIGDTTRNGNKLGDAVNADGTPRDNSTIGWEFDIYNDIQIYKNLQFRFGAGYLYAGKAFDMRDQRTNVNSRDNVAPQNPWAVVTKLLYVF